MTEYYIICEYPTAGGTYWSRLEDKTGCACIVSEDQRDLARWLIMCANHSVLQVTFEPVKEQP